MTQVRDITQGERPREKLIRRGATALSDVELMALLLGSGVRGRDVFAVARELLEVVDQQNGDLTHEMLSAIRGIGPAKACLLSAALEFGRRRIRPHGVSFKGPQDILGLVRHLAARKQEHFVCISLNGAHELIANRVISIGLVDRAHVHPREVFADPLTDRASAVVVAHNHPSRNILPSSADIDVTKRLAQAGDLLGIKLLDHIIFNEVEYYSFAESSSVLERTSP